MRYSRIFLRAQGNHFHVVSRIAGREFLLGENEKRVFHRIMRRIARVAGVEVLTHCLMDNHVHLLLRTEVLEEPDPEAIGDRELVSRVRGLYRGGVARELEWQLEQARKRRDRAQVEALRTRYLGRLGNLSEFMRVLKNVFSKWYNKEHGRTGTLWEEDRYKVVLVEGSEAVLRKVAAYIDLNPVRAGMVEDPGDYAWSGYGESCRGGAEARRGLVRVMGVSRQRGWREAGPVYRRLLLVEGEETGRSGGAEGEGRPRQVVVRRRDGKVVERGAIAREKVETEMEVESQARVKKEREKAPAGPGLQELLRKQARYWTDGVILGTREFVDRVFGEQDEEVRGKRKSGARRMRGGDWGDGGLYTLRDLRKDVFGDGGDR